MRVGLPALRGDKVSWFIMVERRSVYLLCVSNDVLVSKYPGQWIETALANILLAFGQQIGYHRMILHLVSQAHVSLEGWSSGFLTTPERADFQGQQTSEIWRSTGSFDEESPNENLRHLWMFTHPLTKQYKWAAILFRRKPSVSRSVKI